MRNTKFNIGLLLLLSSLIFASSLGIVLATDDDSDGIDDDFEDATKRSLNVEVEDDKIKVESVLRTGTIKNKVEFELRNETNGVTFSIEFTPNYDATNESEIELEFQVRFREIVEYIDEDSNGIYNDVIDTEIQVYELDSYKTTQYTVNPISADTSMHYFIISTTDDVFKAHAYFVEEFNFVNDTLVTPSETKIDIEINNFNYLNDSSRLALLTKLEAEVEYEEEEETEDEELGYADDEKGVFAVNNTHIGFFTWKENASIDDVSMPVLKSPIEVDPLEPNEQKLYLNYPRGTVIYHDPKVGIKGFFASTSPGLISGYGIVTFLIGTLFSIGTIVFLYKRRQRN
jgi:hypothetical protein